ncbi:hypothetical protein JTE90_002411 [Oedothorax gibbosus]|uniref:Connectin n=1 Tax=Oedothorax gibbosus TaxID=931172 RepID=A0AAV6UWL4_9ARAC|nr:hypothetical protein JTE90_002411 [Oedothorax gibbosus]
MSSFKTIAYLCHSFTLNISFGNPIKCDCRLRWVKTYLHLNKSHQFSRELKELRCRNDGDNQTLHIVHQLKMDCNATEDLGSSIIEDNESRTNMDHDSSSTKDRKSRPMKDPDSEPTTDPEARTAHVPAAISFEKSSTSSGSYNKNKTRLGSVVEVPDVQDSEAMDEDFGGSSVEANGRQGSNSISGILRGDARLVLLMTFVSYFLVRKRKGTML